MCFLPLKSSHYPSRPFPVPELFGKYPTRPVPKSKTPTRQTLPTTQVMHIHNDLCTCPLYFNAITLTDTCTHCIFRNPLNLSSHEEYGPNI